MLLSITFLNEKIPSKKKIWSFYEIINCFFYNLITKNRAKNVKAKLDLPVCLYKTIFNNW